MWGPLSFKVFYITNQTVEFKVHQLTTYITTMFYSMNEVKCSSLRRVMMVTDEINRRSIQYVVKFNGDYTALITMPRRPQEMGVLKSMSVKC